MEQVFTPSCPERIVAYAAARFGPQVWNVDARTRRVMEREFSFTIEVWVKKYGPLNAEQEEYAWDLFEWSIRDTIRSAKNQSERISHFCQNTRRLLNDDRAHEGMKKRAARLKAVVDTAGLMEAA